MEKSIDYYVEKKFVLSNKHTQYIKLKTSVLRKFNVLIIKEEREFNHPKARKIVSLVVHSEKKKKKVCIYAINLCTLIWVEK